jgi:hypothetical protein
MLFLLGSSVCKHIFKKGKHIGNLCGNPSKFKDSLCFKHRYRYIDSFNNFYKSFKYLFDNHINIIKDKKNIKKMLFEKEKDNKIEKLEIEYISILIKKENISHYDYLDKLEILTRKLINIYDKDLVNKLISSYVYKYIPDKFGTKAYVDYSNYYLKKIKRPIF